MVLEQFLGMLNTDLQEWVREHTPRSSAEAADLVETFVTARPSRRKYFLGPPQHDWRRPYQAAQQEPEKVLEQFLGMLNTDLQEWVREHTPRSSAEAADLVETFVTARPSRRKYFLGPPQHDWRRPYQAAQQEPEKTSTVSLRVIVVVWLSPPIAPIAPVLAPLQLEHLEALFVMVVVNKVTLGPIVRQRKCLILDCVTYLALASTHIVLPLT
ncbi:unnamed protein product [Arctogadus glacialis]